MNPPVITVLTRSFGDPIAELRKSINESLNADFKSVNEIGALRNMLEDALKKISPSRLVIIFDQFEELLIIHQRNPERLELIRKLLVSLVEHPIDGLCVMLAFRSDYLHLIETFKLPPMMYRKNWFEVGAFIEPHARKFMKQSNLDFPDETLDTLFEQLAAYEGTKGLIRPIILNMVGLIFMKSGDAALIFKKKRTENLLAEYLRHHLFHKDMKDHAPKILDHMITEVGTKTPQSVKNLSDLTGIPQAEVRGTLNLLDNAALVRQIDPVDEIWEIAHDFIAHHLLILLRGTKRPIFSYISPYLAPIALGCWLLIIIFYLPQFIVSVKQNVICNALRAEGAEISYNDDKSLYVKFVTPDLPSQKVFDYLLKLPDITALELDQCQIGDDSLKYVEKLTKLRYLVLNNNQITDKGLSELKNLKYLEHMRISNNFLTGTGFASFKSSESLTFLDAGLNQITDEGLSCLREFTSLKVVKLGTNQITDEGLIYLSGMKNMVELDLCNNSITSQGLVNLRELKSITKIVLAGNNLRGEEIEYICSFDKIVELYLYNASLNDGSLAYIKNLTSLQILMLKNNEITDKGLSHLAVLRNLRHLVLGCDGISDKGLEELTNLKSLQTLEINPYKFTDNTYLILNKFPSLSSLVVSNIEKDIILPKLRNLRSTIRINYL
jgi:Leucine-rich repeat (LRR) protein